MGDQPPDMNTEMTWHLRVLQMVVESHFIYTLTNKNISNDPLNVNQISQVIQTLYFKHFLSG